MFKKSRSIAFFLIICICFALTACSGSSDDSGNDEDAALTDSQEELMDDLDVDIAYDDDIGDSVKIPDGYPSNLLPIYEDSYVFSVVEFEGGFTITAFSKDDYNEVANFYKDFLQDSEVTYEATIATGYARFGTIDGYTYNLDTSMSEEFEDYASSLVIMLIPAQ